MIFSKQIFINSIKKVSATTLVGVCALFGTQMLISTELNASTIVPTSYNLSELHTAMNRQIPDGYIKTNYKVNFIEKSEKSEKPSASELSLEDATEIMAQEIFRFSKEDLSNQTLTMIYDPASTMHTFEKNKGYKDYELLASWDCSLKLSTYIINVSIDSSTGELLTIGMHYLSKSNVPYYEDEEFMSNDIDPAITKAMDSADKNFKSNKAQILEKVKKLISQAGYLSDSIKSIEYTGVYYEGNSNLVIYSFKITTTSDKQYHFDLYEGLTRFSNIATPAHLKQYNR